MGDKDTRTVNNNQYNQYNSQYNQCVLGEETGPQTIIVRQVVGEQEKQKVLDIHVVVPDRKPSIEQIIDVFVKNVEVLSVDVITDKVVVRGEFELKAIYVAYLPDQPVHAVEIKHYKFTQDIDIFGARKGMDADASVSVEFVDYDVAEKTRAYKYKHYDHLHCDEDEEEEEAEEEECAAPCPEYPVAEVVAEEGLREFDVSVVLKITGKVLTDRQVTLGAVGGGVPLQPKG
ncbi:MAG TPA: DUF3794 domain-containing protein [Methylomusa anaerophila]|uniref:SipL SPOCS domain-containing protein n=1 Tax=Methylomusa anaerophila TaxID=1930071 RepID=A0A348AGW7_9FIRM|nr:DUF3794 domain-containing protein [Methylomusa anaerophila]BBB90315.1 hypothetical protein MAMMFC1_00963 [Methylomusa anaerophila]HML89339.1 DUF3794 domain-containing protein [Methylomusa anaerophila]